MAKHSLGRYYSGYFKMPEIRRQDLSEIEEVILKDLQPQSYHITCQGFEYDRVEDIPADSRPAVTLVVYTHAPCLRLKFARSWSELYCEENNERIAPVIQRISDVVTLRERRGLWRLSKFSIWMAPTIGFGAFCEVGLLVGFDVLPHTAVYGGFAVLILTYIWWMIGYRYTLFRFSRIHFDNK